MRRFAKALAIVLIAMVLLGCTSGMRSPPICRNICPPGQTQNPYPDCRCVGEPFSGVVVRTPTPTPFSGGGVIPPSPTPTASQEGQGFPGGAAKPGPNEGLIFVTFRAEPMSSVENVVMKIKEIDAYRIGPDSGWVILSGSRKTYDFSSMAGKEYPAAVAKAGVGSYAYLRIAFDENITVYRVDGRKEVKTPDAVVVLMKLPVSEGATSAVRLSFDWDRSFQEDEDGYWFAPYLTVETDENVQYQIKDDGSAVIRGDEVLKEEASFTKNIIGHYMVIEGRSAPCVRSCVEGCGSRNTTVACHDACMRVC